MTEDKARKGFLERVKVPHVYTLIFVILVLVAIGTYLIPAGAFNRVKDAATGRTVVDPNSFHAVKQAPIGILDLFVAIPSGMEAAVNIMMLVVLVCAAFEIVTASGAFKSGITYLMKAFQGKETFILIGVTILFSAIGAFLGWAEGNLVFVPLGVSLARAMGYDALVGAGIVLLGGAAGFTSGVLNIYTTGICQALAGLPLFSALDFRMVSYVLFTGIGIVYITRYARRIKGRPDLSLVADVEAKAEKVDLGSVTDFTARHRLILAVVAVGFIAVAYGTTKLGWYLKEITGVFILIGILSGLLAGMSADQMAQHFAAGAKTIIPAALTIGFARSVLVVMEKGQILDSIVNGLATMLKGQPSAFVALGIFLITAFFNVFVISASGKAVTMLPILLPLADIMKVPRQVTILAFQFGDGFTNWYWPTSAITMAGLAMAGGIPYDRWARWAGPLMLIWHALAAALVVIAQMIGVGPF
ncbi:MAG: YfcC family protein [Firmicutes bacterium]|nr:YfcC family protein [Bacillota bacterium]